LGIGSSEAPLSSARNVAEVGIVADHDRPDRVAGVSQERFQRLDLERSGQPVVE
jgi:hypothetical protein